MQNIQYEINQEILESYDEENEMYADIIQAEIKAQAEVEAAN